MNPNDAIDRIIMFLIGLMAFMALIGGLAVVYELFCDDLRRLVQYLRK